MESTAAEVQQTGSDDITKISGMSDEKLNELLVTSDGDGVEEQAIVDEQTETQKTTTEEPPIETKPDETETAAETTETTTEQTDEERLKAQEEEIEKLKRQIDEKEKFSQRLANEKGEINSQLKQFLNVDVNATDFDPFALLTKEEIEKYDELAVESPSQAQRFFNQTVGARHREIRNYQIQQAQYAQEQTKSDIKAKIPDYETYVDDVVALAIKDGLPEENIRNYRSNPYATDFESARHYTERAKLTKENASLRAENDALKAKLSGLPEKINAAVRKKPLVGSGGEEVETTKIKASNPNDLRKLSDEQLASILNA